MVEVINFLPKRKYPFLDHKFGMIVGDEDFYISCAKRGCFYLGQVVQHTEEGFFEKYDATEKQRTILIEEMRELGFTFNMRAPNWRPPEGRDSPYRSEMDLEYK